MSDDFFLGAITAMIIMVVILIGGGVI